DAGCLGRGHLIGIDGALRLGGVMTAAERGVDDGDVVLNAVIDDPLEGLCVAGIGDVVVVVDAEDDDARARRDALVFGAVESVGGAYGDGGDTGAVPVDVHGIAVVVDEVVASQIFAGEGRVVVVNAGVDN